MTAIILNFRFGALFNSVAPFVNFLIILAAAAVARSGSSLSHRRVRAALHAHRTTNASRTPPRFLRDTDMHLRVWAQLVLFVTAFCFNAAASTAFDFPVLLLLLFHYRAEISFSFLEDCRGRPEAMLVLKIHVPCLAIRSNMLEFKTFVSGSAGFSPLLTCLVRSIPFSIKSRT
eukprot:IDg4223t1